MKLGYPNDNGAKEPVFAIVRLSEGGYEIAVMKGYIELVKFSHQLSLKSYNELVFLLQLLLQDLVLFSPRILHTKHTQIRLKKIKKSVCVIQAIAPSLNLQPCVWA